MYLKKLKKMKKLLIIGLILCCTQINVQYKWISYQLSAFSNIQLKDYDLLGREIAVLVNEKLSPGIFEVNWDGSNYSSGIYFYKLVSGDFSETKKLVLMK